MLELPEFQILADQFHTSFHGEVLTGIHVINHKKIKEKPEDLHKLEGSVLKSVIRSGKALDFEFDGEQILQFDLKLHGRFETFEKFNNRQHSIIELTFNHDRGIALTDFQGNANITLNPPPGIAMDALSKDVFNCLISSSQTKTKIKALITNQKIISGIGNMYADEILWEARISPFSKSSAIPEFKIKGLANAIRTVLLNAQKQIVNKKLFLFNTEGYSFLNIFGKEGEKSPGGSIIKVEKKAGRSTYYTDEQVLYS